MCSEKTDVKQDDGGLTDLVMRCAFSILAGQSTVTITATGTRPEGFPRGELLSVGSTGGRNFAVCPVKVLAWVHRARQKPRQPLKPNFRTES